VFRSPCVELGLSLLERLVPEVTVDLLDHGEGRSGHPGGEHASVTKLIDTKSAIPEQRG
jgi:hypothetical protein